MADAPIMRKAFSVIDVKMNEGKQQRNNVNGGMGLSPRG